MSDDTHAGRGSVDPGRTDVLADLLHQVVAELRALRRLVGAIALLAVGLGTLASAAQALVR